MSLQVNTNRSNRITLWIVCVLFFFSGFASLTFQTAWNKILGQTVGTDYYSITIIVSIFMIGLGLGGEVGSLVTRRFKKPIIIFVVFEIVVAIFGVCSPFLLRSMPVVTAALGELLPLPALAWDFLANFLLLVGPVVLMGASLPIVVHELRRHTEPGPLVGYLYSVNIFGAVCGVLVSGVLMIGMLGVSVTIQIAALMNLLIAFAGLLLLPKFKPVEDESERGNPEPIASRWLAFAFAIGFVTLGLEIFYFRVLTYYFGATSYVFPVALTSFLLLMFSGNLTAGRLLKVGLAWQQVLTIAAFGALLSLSLVFVAPKVMRFDAIHFGGAMSPVVLLQALAFSLIVMLPVLFVSMIFPTAVAAVTSRAENVGANVGRLYFVQTFGNFFGALVTGFVLLPHLGTLGTARLLAGLIFFAFVFQIVSASKFRIRHIGATAFALILALLTINTNFFLNFTYRDAKPSRISEELEGTAFLYDTPLGTRIHIGSEPATSYNSANLSVPVWPMDVALAVLNREPKRMLIIGIGTGFQAQTVRALYPNAQIDVVELLDVVIREMKERGNDDLKASLEDFNVFVTDGRRFVNKRESGEPYDIVQIGVFHVTTAGAGNLFTREFLDKIKSITAPDGVITFNAYVPVVADAKDRFEGVLVASRGDYKIADVFLVPAKSIDSSILATYWATRKLIQGKLVAAGKERTFVDAHPPDAFFTYSKEKIDKVLQGIRGQTDDFVRTEYFLSNQITVEGFGDPRQWPGNFADVAVGLPR